MPEDVARFTVLLEDIQTQVRAIADGHAGLTERMERMDAQFGRLEAKVDHLEVTVGTLATNVDGLETQVGRLQTQVGGLETRVGGLQTKFDGFASETRLRLKRIEGHLALAGPSSRRRTAMPAPSRRRRKTAKPS
jgi:outer membrane murein-binding lipoprotein Lpp